MPEHIEYLTAEATLTLWAGYTLRERAKFFHRKFPDKFISPMVLWRLYKRHGITRKAIRKAKTYPAGGED